MNNRFIIENIWRSSAIKVMALALISCIIGSPLFAADKLVGTTPPEWQFKDWINSPPITLKSLRGKVVLVRWWTAPDCPYCKATAPALNEFYENYHEKGLEVVGFYHHKSDEPLKVETVQKYSDKFGFKFPVAIDPDWKNLHRWWLDNGKHTWTSVSFLIDRKGVIRHIHPGGEYVSGDKDYAEMKAQIEKLIQEK
jgi:peroxiredoxin